MPKYLNSIDSDLSQPKNIKAIFKDLQPETYKTLQPLDVQKMLGARSLGQKLLSVNEWSEENNIIAFTNDDKFYYSVNPITRKLQKCEVPKDLSVGDGKTPILRNRKTAKQPFRVVG